MRDLCKDTLLRIEEEKKPFAGVCSTAVLQPLPNLVLVSGKLVQQKVAVFSDFTFFVSRRLFSISSSPPSSVSELLEPGKWLVRYAPPPEDIYWENIVDSHGTYIAKAIIINFFMFFLLVSLFNCYF